MSILSATALTATTALVGTVATAPTADAATTASASSQYVAVTTSKGVERLQLVNRATGRVVSTLASAKVGSDGQAFGDADLAADGSVYAVRYGKAPYGTTLVRFARGRATTIARYVTSVKASPNGRELAVTVVSPDANKDGRGTQALRILTPAGKLVRTLNTTTFPVDKNGIPMMETGTTWVSGWAGRSTLVLGSGCCSESNVHLVRADVPRSARAWVTLPGSDDTAAIGVRGTSVLVGRQRDTGDGHKVPLRKVGFDMLWLSSKTPKGALAGRVNDADHSLTQIASGLNKRYGATPLVVGPTTFPFKGAGTVLRAYI